MTISAESSIESLGLEPFERFGFSTEEELTIALFPLMQETQEEIDD